MHGRPAGAMLVGSPELRRARASARACDRGEGGGALLAWLDRCAQGRKRVREKHAHVRASPGVRRGRRQLGRARRVVEVGRAVFDAVTLAIAAVLFPLLARRAALGARGVVARVRTLEALPACRPAAVALELPRCNPPSLCENRGESGWRRERREDLQRQKLQATVIFFARCRWDPGGGKTGSASRLQEQCTNNSPITGEPSNRPSDHTEEGMRLTCGHGRLRRELLHSCREHLRRQRLPVHNS